MREPRDGSSATLASPQTLSPLSRPLISITIFLSPPCCLYYLALSLILWFHLPLRCTRRFALFARLRQLSQAAEEVEEAKRRLHRNGRREERGREREKESETVNTATEYCDVDVHVNAEYLMGCQKQSL